MAQEPDGLKSSVCLLKSLLHPHTMCLLGVPHTTSSFCSTPHSLSPNTLHTTGIRNSLNATPRVGGLSGHLDDTTQSTGYEPKTCIDASSEYTPINLPVTKESYNFQNDWKFAVSEDSYHLPRRAAASSSRHSVASTVPALLNLGS